MLGGCDSPRALLDSFELLHGVCGFILRDYFCKYFFNLNTAFAQVFSLTYSHNEYIVVESGKEYNLEPLKLDAELTLSKCVISASVTYIYTLINEKLNVYNRIQSLQFF